MRQEIGTVTTIDEQEAKPKRRPGLGGGTSGGGGGNNGRRGGGGGGDRRDNNNQPQHDEEFKPEKYRLAMWIALVMIGMTFGGMIGAYVFISLSKAQEWQPFDLPIQVFVSTAIILMSSVTFEFARVAMRQNQQKRFFNWLLVTTALGAIFIASQLFVWLQLVNKGYYLSGNPYAGFFYILTAAHAAHILGGLVALGYIVLRASKPTRNAENLLKRQTATNVVGLFWHSMDGLWLVLLALLTFVK